MSEISRGLILKKLGLAAIMILGLASTSLQTTLAQSTIVISDDSTGGNCTLVGTWDAKTRTCVLTTDLTDPVQIISNAVTLDCNNHFITGSTGEGTGLLIDNVRRVTVKNCAVDGFQYQFEVKDSSAVYLYHNTANNSGEFPNTTGFLVGGTHNVLDDNTSQNHDFGAQISGRAMTVINNSINDNQNGIQVTATGSFLDNNEVNNNDANFGIRIAGTRNTVSNNSLSGNGNAAILIESNQNRITGNTASNNLEDGIKTTLESSADASKNNISENTANNNGGFGFVDDTTGSKTAGTANTYQNNTCLDNIFGGSEPAGLCNDVPVA
ncbi:MAG: right-handed parallel beta-helix repeat-containing protein [Nitrosopumilaceae archaeon]